MLDHAAATDAETGGEPARAVGHLAERQCPPCAGVRDRGPIGVCVRAGEDRFVYELCVHVTDRMGARAAAVVTDVM